MRSATRVIFAAGAENKAIGVEFLEGARLVSRARAAEQQRPALSARPTPRVK
jgi:hypothetical protein